MLCAARPRAVLDRLCRRQGDPAPHANVYQALNALARKGAVVFEDESSRAYSAVPPPELLGRLRRSFESECATVEQAFAAMQVEEPEGERLYRFTTRDQVLARALRMIDGARECVLAYAGPDDAAPLKSALEDAVRRDVSVAGLMLRDIDLPAGSHIRVSRVADQLATVWPNIPMIVIADAREVLLARFGPGPLDVRNALWTRSRFLASLFHNAIVSDTILHSLPAIEEIRSPNRYLLGTVPDAVLHLLDAPENAVPAGMVYNEPRDPLALTPAVWSSAAPMVRSRIR